MTYISDADMAIILDCPAENITRLSDLDAIVDRFIVVCVIEDCDFGRYIRKIRSRLDAETHIEDIALKRRNTTYMFSFYIGEDVKQE